MNLPDTAQDLHQARLAIDQGLSSLSEQLGQALVASEQPACRHAYVLPPQDALRQAITDQRTGQAGPLAGLPVSVKDLFDVAGQTSRGGSVVLQGPAAQADCPAVARLRAAGGLIAGRTNMTEFAFSGVGINPHYGTPVNPADHRVARIAGGSSSGAAVSVALGAAMVGLGSDTGGSLRIPAALCGLVGFKSTARLVPTEGAIPLSTTLDTVGAITRSVRDAITVHEILAQRRVSRSGKPLTGAVLAVASTCMLDDMQTEVAQAFERSLRVLSAAGAQIVEIELKPISELAQINASGGFSAAESHAWHRHLLERHVHKYDPRVAKRILRGAHMSAADYVDLLAARKRWIASMTQGLAGYDAVISPTVPMVAPPIAELEHDDDAFFRVNALLLRNTLVINMLDGCALSLPCQAPGQLPVGLMLWHGAMRDDPLLELSLQVEAALSGP